VSTWQKFLGPFGPETVASSAQAKLGANERDLRRLSLLLGGPSLFRASAGRFWLAEDDSRATPGAVGFRYDGDGEWFGLPTYARSESDKVSHKIIRFGEWGKPWS
jgi:hypothetical protein